MTAAIARAVVLAVVLGLCVACGSEYAGPESGETRLSPTVTDRLAQVVTLAHQDGVPGIAADVTVAGQGSWRSVTGLADRARNQPVTPESKFAIGSITKTFTATAVLQLVDQGKLKLSDSLSNWEPQVQNAEQITVQMLLDMTSGIFDEGGPGSTLVAQTHVDPGRVFTPREIVDMAIAQGPRSPPGQRVYYSNTNYILLGMIVQEVTGQSIEQVITDQILGPLHLANTSFPTAEGIPGTVGYLVQDGRITPAPRLSPTVFGAAGAMISTLDDMRLWAHALGTGALLSPATAELRLRMFQPTTTFRPLRGSGITAPMPAGYGLGLINLGGLLGHNGVIPGYEADIYYQPSSGASIVILTNGEVTTTFAGLQQVSDAMVVSMSQIALPP
jgi:D-alanyl-D-alanine carboxypeptidase